VLHVHDEIVVEMRDGEGSLAEFKDLIERLPDWAAGLPVAAKARNGPRFAACDMPVVHVAGATEAPFAKPGKAKKPARPQAATDLPSLPDYPPITETALDAAEPRGRLMAWILERERIRLHRLLRHPAPWSDNPIMAAARFCNVYRKYDRGTIYVTENIVAPHRDNPDLWFAITVARCINEPDAIAEILPHVLPFDAVRCREIIEARQARGEKCFRTEAYKPPTPPVKGDSTIRLLIEDVLAPMWRDREALRPRLGDALAAYSTRLEACYRIGPFLAAQIIADLKPIKPLRSAADWWAYARPGPGSERGLNRARGRLINASWPAGHWYRDLAMLHAEIAPRLAALGFESLDMQDLQNVCCEFDKYERIRDGGKINRPYKTVATAETKDKPEAKPEAKPEPKPEPKPEAATQKPADTHADTQQTEPRQILRQFLPIYSKILGRAPRQNQRRNSPAMKVRAGSSGATVPPATARAATARKPRPSVTPKPRKTPASRSRMAFCYSAATGTRAPSITPWPTKHCCTSSGATICAPTSRRSRNGRASGS
jgi:hypothetical protein